MIGYDRMFAGFMATPAVAVSMCSMPQAIFEFKQSTLLKRIGSTPIRPWMFLFAAGAFYVLIMILGTIFSFLMALAIFSGNFSVGREIFDTFSMGGNPVAPLIAPSIQAILNGINWGGFIWGNIMNIMVGVTLGLMFVSLCKSSSMVSGVGIPVLLISGFITGQYLPISMIKDGGGILYDIGYITPFKGPIGLMLEAWNGDFDIQAIKNTSGVVDHYQTVITNQLNIFDIHEKFYIFANNPMDEKIVVFTVADNVLNLVLPFVWSGLFVGISIKFFKWSV